MMTRIPIFLDFDLLEFSIPSIRNHGFAPLRGIPDSFIYIYVCRRRRRKRGCLFHVIPCRPGWAIIRSCEKIQTCHSVQNCCTSKHFTHKQGQFSATHLPYGKHRSWSSANRTPMDRARPCSQVGGWSVWPRIIIRLAKKPCILEKLGNSRKFSAFGMGTGWK